MYRLAVEFPLFYGNEREDVREFIDNYSRAGRLNGWDEEKLALGLPLFLKHQASVWFKTLTEAENESFQVLSQKLISHFESSVTLWQVRQKLEERKQLQYKTLISGPCEGVRLIRYPRNRGFTVLRWVLWES